MEEWQQECIRKNLSKLIEYTKCNVSLLAKLQEERVLIQEEAEILKSKSDFEGSSQLYTWVITKANSYEALKDALRATYQSGAHAILQNASLDRENYDKYEVLTYESNVHKYSNNYNSNTTVHKGQFGTRPALVKLYRKETEDSISQSQVEMDILTRYDWHQNIVRCFIGKQIIKEFQQYYAIVMDHLINLVEFIQQGGTVIRRRLVKQVCDGLSFIHQNHVLHLNLRPESIFIHQPEPSTANPNGVRVKIGGFGFARFRERYDPTISVNIGKLQGAACFETPEILQKCYCEDIDDVYSQSCEISCSTDIFCLAIVVYFILSGGQHVYGKNEFARGPKILARDRSGIDVNALPKGRKSKFFNMISRNPNKRPAMTELNDLFDDIQNNRPNCVVVK